MLAFSLLNSIAKAECSIVDINTKQRKDTELIVWAKRVIFYFCGGCQTKPSQSLVRDDTINESYIFYHTCFILAI